VHNSEKVEGAKVVVHLHCTLCALLWNMRRRHEQ